MTRLWWAQFKFYESIKKLRERGGETEREKERDRQPPVKNKPDDTTRKWTPNKIFRLFLTQENFDLGFRDFSTKIFNFQMFAKNLRIFR